MRARHEVKAERGPRSSKRNERKAGSQFTPSEFRSLAGHHLYLRRHDCFSTSPHPVGSAHRTKIRAKHGRASCNSLRSSPTICPALGRVETQLKRSLLSTTSHFTSLV